MKSRRGARQSIPGRHHRPWTAAVPAILLEWFQDLRTEGLAKNTCVNYAFDLRDLAGFLSIQLERAKTEDLRAYRRSLLVRNLAIASCARRITAIRVFYDWLRRRDGLTASIAQDLRPPKIPERVHHFWTKAEVARFRRAFTGDDPTTLRDRAMMELGLMGLRVSKVVGLDTSRIRELEVPARAAIVVKRKGGGEQYLPLTQEARQLAIVFSRIPFQPSRPRLVYVSVEKIFKKYAAIAGVAIPKGIAFHLLRHTAGQRMSDVGLGIEEAQRVLGHRSPRTTQVYYQVGDKRLRKAIRRLRY